MRRWLTPLLHVVSGDLIASYITVYIIVGVRPGGRGARGPRAGRGVSVTTQSVGLNKARLVADGVRADVLERLLPREQGITPTTEVQGEIIPFNQVVMRGEDITGQLDYTSSITMG